MSYLLDQKGKTTESGDAKLAFDSLDPTNLEQFIEDGLLGYCTSAIIENSFLNESKGRAGEIYSGRFATQNLHFRPVCFHTPFSNASVCFQMILNSNSNDFRCFHCSIFIYFHFPCLG